jgi:hypothetical protein
MSIAQEQGLTVQELSRLLEATDPAALLVAPRLLRRIIKHDRKLTHLGLQVPHRKSYVIGREALRALVDPEELELEPGRALPATLLLLYRPEPEELRSLPRGETLVKYWRLLFHARVHLAMALLLEKSQLSEAALRRRIHQIGQTEFDEARSVLRQEKFLLPPYDDRTAYEEFSALYLELSYFAAPLLPRYFPSIEDFEHIDKVLAGEVDGASLFAATRLPGAPDPVFAVEGPDRGEAPAPPASSTLIWSGSDKAFEDLALRADKAAAAGNVVRAAVFRARAAQVAPPLLASEAHDRAEGELGRLVTRLKPALGLTDAQAEAWRQALPALLATAAEGLWPPEARMLYDLQKVCVDFERPLYETNFIEWAYSGFRRLLRPLPNQPFVLAVKHLRVAVNRLSSIRVTEPERRSLSTLLHEGLHHAEGRLRDCFRPAIRDALARVELRPRNLPERLAESKVVEELLDRITERGFLNMGDLRDALARNQLKLPDLSGPGEFFKGDPLIRANRELAVGAGEVYRRGEFYLRWLQRASALAFGTPPGRFLMLFFALPFLGAFATIVFVQEMLHLLRILHIAHVPHHLTPVDYAFATGALGIFFLLLMHVPTFRRAVVRGLQLSWRAVHQVVIELPAAFLALPVVRRVFESRSFLILVRFVVKPLPAAFLTWLVLSSLEVEPTAALASGAATWLVLSVVINSRLGRDLEETVIDRTVRNWEYLRGLLPGLVRLLANFFKAILEAVDRFLYSVDEWLRFRGGEGRLSLAVKTVLGFVWFLVTYVVRLYVNVFIEPTVNPIKHFPVVTVAAKLLLPLWPVLLGTPRHPGYFALPFEFLGRWQAYIIANIILHSLPGVAGFLVWEFKANWRLYRANRPATLQPEMVGHHGETVLRLMKPGFHSGTLPKLYAKLRRAERRASRGGTWKTARRLRESLHHVEESARRFAERELVAFLNASRGWTAGPVVLGGVEVGSNRIRLDLALVQGTGEESVELSFEHQAGWLLADVGRPGWLPRLASDQAAVLTVALLGFYKKAGVDLVREQIEEIFAPAPVLYDIGEEGLIVWPGNGYDTEATYDLREEPILHPRSKAGPSAEKLPTPPADEMIFSKKPIRWQAWVAAWERDQSGAGDPHLELPNVRVLPAVRHGEQGTLTG